MRLDKPSIITCFTAALGHWRGNVSSLPSITARNAAKFAEGTWTINFHSRSRS